MAPKSARTANNLSVQCDTGKAEAFSHHPRIERSCQTALAARLCRSAKSFGRRRSRSPNAARPSLSAAADAAVTRNLALLSGL